MKLFQILIGFIYLIWSIQICMCNRFLDIYVMYMYMHPKNPPIHADIRSILKINIFKNVFIIVYFIE